MSRTTKGVGKAARNLAGKARTAVVKAEQRIEKTVRRRRRARAVREAATTALAAGAAVLASGAVREADALIRRRRSRTRPAAAFCFEVPVPLDPERTVERVTDALKAEGFGVVTRLDLGATLREKLGISFRPYLVLGVCNPALARRVVEARPEAGLLLPCSVSVEAGAEGTSMVRIGDPQAMLTVGGLDQDPELSAVAADAHDLLHRVAEHLGRHARSIAF